MNLTRRQFIKILGLGAAAIVAPKLIASTLKEVHYDEPGDKYWNKRPSVTFHCGPQKKGEYIFSYSYKSNKPRKEDNIDFGEWYRHIQNITLDVDMDLDVQAYFEDGDVITEIQVESVNGVDFDQIYEHVPPTLHGEITVERAPDGEFWSDVWKVSMP